MNEQAGPVALALAGLLAAGANLALSRRGLVLPRLQGNTVRLGFLSQVLVCVGVAWAVDHDCRTAFVWALCGSAGLRELKRHIDAGFARLMEDVNEPK